MPVAERTARFEMVDADGHALGRDGWPAQRVLSGEEMASALIHWFDRVSQRHRWVRVRSSAVLDPKGTPDLAVEIWHDVSLERREELLAEHLAKATLALGSSLISDEMLAPLARVSIPGLGDCVQSTFWRENAFATSAMCTWTQPSSPRPRSTRSLGAEALRATA